MPDILSIVGKYWKLNVWTRDNDAAVRYLQRTLERRGKPLPGSEICFLPPDAVAEVTVPISTDALDSGLVRIESPMFFENKLYEFNFLFDDPVALSPEPRVLHRYISVAEAFHLSGRYLRGSINFGNDIGMFRLGLRFFVGKRPIEHFLAFEVFPTKMDMKEDLDQMSLMVDAVYPLWRFSFVQKTEWELAASKKPHERFPLFWLAMFRSLRGELEGAVKVILRSPHSRLISRERLYLLDRIKGHMPHRLEERAAEEVFSGEKRHRYRIDTRSITVDTPENRFVKMVLSKSMESLRSFTRGMQGHYAGDGAGRLSPYFFAEIDQWISVLKELLSNPLFRAVGDHRGFRQESPVLQKRLGYSKVYRIWQELKLYLDFFGRTASISMKSVAELYEIWCLLEIRNILYDLGIQEETWFKPELRRSFFEKELADGGGIAFVFNRSDGLTVRLSHEPVFSSPKNDRINAIYSWVTVQKPDILMEVDFNDGKVIRWVFDAKYRISNTKGEVDLIPDDALNQMHRYRDALVYLSSSEDGAKEKSRPIIGAFVLYPGWLENEVEGNPYGLAIQEVGIGGFPFLPGRENRWFRAFMSGILGPASAEPDAHLLKDSVRIAPTGLSLSRYGDLALVVSMPGRNTRNTEYSTRFIHGNALWYHLPVSTAENYKVSRNAMREVRYCAVAVSYLGLRGRRIEYIYDVLSVRCVKRSELTAEQAGRVEPSNDNPYWLFELGPSRRLPVPLEVPGVRGFRFMLTGARDIMNSREWKDLPDRYAFLRKKTEVCQSDEFQLDIY